jgi:hypothetical protein
MDCGSLLPLSTASLLASQGRLHSRLWQQSGDESPQSKAASLFPQPQIQRHREFHARVLRRDFDVVHRGPSGTLLVTVQTTRTRGRFHPANRRRTQPYGRLSESRKKFKLAEWRHE